MRKNVASQVICAQLNSKTDGSAVTSGTTTVYVTGDGGTQGTGSGTVTHEGQGCWSYVPTQAETNYNHVAFTFANSTAISQTVQTYPVSYDPTDAAGLGLSRLDAAVTTRASQTSLDTVDGIVDNILLDTAEIGTAGAGLTNINLPNQTMDIVGSITGNLSGSVGSVTSAVTVGTNNDKTGYALSSAAIQALWDALTSALTTVGSIGRLIVDNLNATISSRLASASYTAPLDAAGTRSAVGLASANLDTQLDAIPTANENADAHLKRDWTSVTGEADRSALNALRFLRNKWSVAASTLTVTKEDDSTAAWTGTVTTDAGADPIIGNDPS